MMETADQRDDRRHEENQNKMSSLDRRLGRVEDQGDIRAAELKKIADQTAKFSEAAIYWFGNGKPGQLSRLETSLQEIATKVDALDDAAKLAAGIQERFMRGLKVWALVVPFLLFGMNQGCNAYHDKINHAFNDYGTKSGVQTAQDPQLPAH